MPLGRCVILCIRAVRTYQWSTVVYALEYERDDRTNPNKWRVTYCRERRAIFSTFDPLFFFGDICRPPSSPIFYSVHVLSSSIVIPFFSVRFAFSPPLYIRVTPQASSGQASPCIPLVKNSSTFLFCESLA